MRRSIEIVMYFAIVWIMILQGIRCNMATSYRESNQSELHITAEAIRVKGGWGYKIDVNNRPFIYQNQIPCITGNKPFPSEKCAISVANVVMIKIAHGQLPTLTIAELEKASGIKEYQ